MFEPFQDHRIVQRGIDEALACRDVLTAAPAKPSRLSRLIAWLVWPARWLASRRPGSMRRATPPVVVGVRGR